VNSGLVEVGRQQHVIS